MPRSKRVPLPLPPEARDLVCGQITRAPEPLTARELLKRMDGSLHATEKQLVPLLDELVTAGQLQTFPSGKRLIKYWDRDPVAFAQVQMQRAFSKGKPLTEKTAKSAAKGVRPEDARQAFDRMMASRMIFRHPPATKTGTPRFALQPAAPEPYLKKISKQLEKLGKQLRDTATLLESALVPAESIQAATNRMLEHAGLVLCGLADRVESHVVSMQKHPGESDVDLLAVARRIQPAAVLGALVTVPELRRASGLGKVQFDTAVMQLAREGRIVLHRHDFAAGLPSDEREQLVHDGCGQYFIGLAVRRASSV